MGIMFLVYTTLICTKETPYSIGAAQGEGRAAEVGYQKQRGLEVAGALSKGRGSALILERYFTRKPRSVHLPNGIYAHTFISGEAFGNVWPRRDKKGSELCEIRSIILPRTRVNKGKKVQGPSTTGFV